jgi:hypothetical protein
LQEFRALAATLAPTLKLGDVFCGLVYGEPIDDVVDAGHSAHGFQQLLMLVSEHGAAQRDMTARCGDFDRARVPDVSAHLRSHALDEHAVVCSLMGLEQGPDSRGNGRTAIAQVTRPGIYDISEVRVGLDGLIAQKRPTARAAIRIEEIHRSSANGAAQEK